MECLINVFKHFKIDLSNEKTRTPKAISDEYNEKTLKRMGYELKNNNWTPKSTKKTIEESSSREKTPSGSESARKTLVHELEGIETNLSEFMVQVLELLQKLNEKVDNNITRLLLLEKNV